MNVNIITLPTPGAPMPKKEKEIQAWLNHYAAAGEEVLSVQCIGLPGDPYVMILTRDRKPARQTAVAAYLKVNEAFEELVEVLAIANDWAMIRLDRDPKPLVVRQDELKAARSDSPKKRRIQ